MQRYILTAQQRSQQTQQRRSDRRARAMVVARQAAQHLRQSFGVSRVVAFGSVVSDACFTESSDLDLAVWDLDETDYFQAVGQLQGISEFAIDVVKMETVRAEFVEAIEQGIDL